MMLSQSLQVDAGKAKICVAETSSQDPPKAANKVLAMSQESKISESFAAGLDMIEKPSPSLPVEKRHELNDELRAQKLIQKQTCKVDRAFSAKQAVNSQLTESCTLRDAIRERSSKFTMRYKNLMSTLHDAHHD
eukprot:766438-Hanusia_phi.AAC.2